jgi:hypothetical protein
MTAQAVGAVLHAIRDLNLSAGLGVSLLALLGAVALVCVRAR